MDILFRTTKLRKTCNSLRSAQRRWGTDCGRLVMRRLDELHAAEVLQDIRDLPQVRWRARGHQLTGDRKGQLSLDLKHPYRMIVEPADDPIPRRPDGGLDWSRVTAIRVLEVTDTHG